MVKVHQTSKSVQNVTRIVSSINSKGLNRQAGALQNNEFYRQFSTDNKDDDEDKKKSSGFEKFLKKTRKGTTNDKPATEPVGDDNEKPSEKEDKKDKKDSKKMKREEEDEDLTEEEHDKEEEKKEKEKDTKSKFQKDVEGFFNDPNGKGPRWENIGLVAFLTAAMAYAFSQNQPSSKEITYIEFVNQYLAQNQCEMITISEDKTSDMFKYRAQITTVDGERVHLVLPQVENFLYKIDTT